MPEYKNKKSKIGPRPGLCLNYDVKIGPKPSPKGIKKSGPGLKRRALYMQHQQFSKLDCIILKLSKNRMVPSLFFLKFLLLSLTDNENPEFSVSENVNIT